MSGVVTVLHTLCHVSKNIKHNVRLPISNRLAFGNVAIFDEGVRSCLPARNSPSRTPLASSNSRKIERARLGVLVRSSPSRKQQKRVLNMHLNFKGASHEMCEKCARKSHNMSPTCTYRQSLILRWKLLNPPQNLLKILPMIAGALHRLNTPPFSLSGRLSHFRTFSQIFDTGFGRLSPLSPFPSHHSPLALYARSHHPSLSLLACSRVPQSPLSPGKACGGGSISI